MTSTAAMASKEIWGLLEASVQLSETSAQCLVQFASSEPFFSGHFPDYPLVPGMVMVEGLVRLAQRLAQTSAPLQAISDAKFMSEVRPGDVATYHVQREAVGFSGWVQVAERTVLKTHFTL